YNLNSYSGQQVYIAIQCTSDDQFGFAVDDFKVVTAPLATTAPSCPTLNTPANGATNVSYNSVSLSWTAATTGGAADSYDVYLDKNPNPTTLVGNTTATSYTAANLDGSSTYYWKIIPKNAIGSATGCNVHSFTTAAPAYCTAGATSTSFEKISNVTFAGINNNSTATVGYEDFTNVTGNIQAGQTYPFSATVSGTSYSSDQVLVWIDFNNDKDFDDQGEQVLVTPTKTSPWTGNITIPANATLGDLRMRVRLHDSSIGGNVTPCGTSSYGQVEDYTLNVTLGVNDNVKAAVKVYPNPVVDMLNVESPNKVKSVSVFDLTGKVVSTHTLNAAKSQINLSKMAPGVYMVNIETDNGIQTVKVIKK
ncbi:GEVED domain-containing protein, partial [Kaistella sp.]|uniref:GEVED domain-containing protein n=1 Tax=Kaistella sp. TaxID=2782235 RepID=UPI002F95C2BA